MKIGGKSVNCNAKEIVKELKEDEHSAEKIKFMKESKAIAKKNGGINNG